MSDASLPAIAVFDVDGVLTTGQFLYSIDGKAYKIFGPHDNDGIKLLCRKMPVLFLTADRRGFQISRKRVVDDMKQELVLVGESERLEYLEKRFGLSNVIYMGDGYHDAAILERCRYGIAPISGRVEARNAAHWVTPSPAGDGAVLDACLHIIDKFFS
jgi:3-deoxy-D-manno-octulosonate 8-phosphate phosphatase (KDO 8-P phosphatase)